MSEPRHDWEFDPLDLRDRLCNEIARLRSDNTSLTSRLEAAEKERDEARAKYQKLILSENGYGPALAQQDRRIEELESKCERLISSCERTESERDEAKRDRDAATAEAARLRKGRDEYERQIASRDRTIRADSAALASAHRRAEEAEKERDEAREKVASLRLIANVNGDWTVKVTDAHRRAEEAEAVLRETLAYAVMKWGNLDESANACFARASALLNKDDTP